MGMIKFTKRSSHWWLVKVAGIGCGMAMFNVALAETTISTFDNFNLDGLFASWASAMVVSSPTGYSIAATGYGSGYKTISPNIDATGETNIQMTITLSGSGGRTAPISGPIVSLV